MDETTSYRSSSSRASSSSRSRRVQTFSTLDLDRARASFPIVSVQFDVYVLFLAALNASSRSPLNSSRTSRPVARTNLNDAAPMSTTYFRPRPSARPTARSTSPARVRSSSRRSTDSSRSHALYRALCRARPPRVRRRVNPRTAAKTAESLARSQTHDFPIEPFEGAFPHRIRRWIFP